MPGHIGKKRSELESRWNKEYGKGNWKVAWETPQGKILDYSGIIQVYIEGYVEYFKKHPGEADHVTSNFSYCYDKNLVTKEEAFDPYALYNRPGAVNQFHHAAMNKALEEILGIPFKGEVPLKVRSGNPDMPENLWPLGWHWQPGLIPCAHPEEIFDIVFEGQWRKKGSIEDFYQSNKALQIKIPKSTRGLGGIIV